MAFETGSDNEKITELENRIDDILDSQLNSVGGNEAISIDATRGQRNDASGDAGGVRSNQPIFHQITDVDESGTPTGVFDKINLISSMIIVDHTSTPIDLRFIQGIAKEGVINRITPKIGKTLVIKSGGNILTTSDITITDKEVYEVVKYSAAETGVTGGAYKISKINGGAGNIPNGTIENEHLEWNNSTMQWEAKVELEFGATGPFADSGFLRFANDQIIAASRNLADDGNMELKFNGAGLLDFTESANNPVGLQLRAQNAVNPDATLTITQFSDLGGSGGIVDIDALNSQTLSISVDGTGYWVFDNTTTENKALQNIQMAKRDILDVSFLEMRDDGIIPGTIVFNPSGVGDTTIQGNISDAERIDVLNNGINGWFWTFDPIISKVAVGLIAGTAAFMTLTDHALLFSDMVIPPDSDISNEQGAVFFDTSTDPPILKIKKKDSLGAVSTVSLEAGGGGANTALSNLAAVAINTSLLPDSDGGLNLGSAAFAWNDVFAERVRFEIGGVISNSVNLIIADAGGMRFNVPAADRYEFLIGGASVGVALAEETIQFLTSGRQHTINVTAEAIKIIAENLTDAVMLQTSSGRSNENVKVEDFKTTFFTDKTEIAAMDIQLVQNNDTPMDGRTIGNVLFIAENSASVDTPYGQISVTSKDTFSGSEDGILQIGVAKGGAVDVAIEIESFVGIIEMDFKLKPVRQFVVQSRTDTNRGAAGTTGKIIFNTDDGQLNIDDGTNWTLPDGTVT